MDYIEIDKDVNFRSRLNEIPLELKTDIATILLQDGWNNIKRRKEMISLADYCGLEYKDVGTGTNRFIIKYDGYALKIALDDEGVNDNKQEWAIGYNLPRLNPAEEDASIPFEVSKGGHLLVADYVPAFTSYNEMLQHKDHIAKILDNWYRHGYLLGDVGIQSKNYANWGIKNGRAVCIDYAYIFRASSTIFSCNICGNTELTLDPTYSNYTCPNCRNTFPDAFLRARINSDIRAELFKDSINEKVAIEMKEGETNKVVTCKIKEPVRYNPDAPEATEGFCNAYNLFRSRQ